MTNEKLRQSIYAGSLQRLPADSLSRHLIDLVEREVVAVFGKCYRERQDDIDVPDYYSATQRAKKAVFAAQAIRDAAVRLIASHGFAPSENAIDPPRVRFIEHDGHLSSSATVAYQAHRDTWYANPQSQINWWMPLHDVAEAETFCFHTYYFRRPIKNTSGQFDYDTWMREVGFGKSHNAAPEAYPLPQEPLHVGSEPPTRFSLKRGEVLLFSGAHLHQTLPNTSGLTRVSIDFRTVNLADAEKGIGAPNVDNESTGSALSTYLRIADPHV